MVDTSKSNYPLDGCIAMDPHNKEDLSFGVPEGTGEDTIIIFEPGPCIEDTPFAPYTPPSTPPPSAAPTPPWSLPAGCWVISSLPDCPPCDPPPTAPPLSSWPDPCSDPFNPLIVPQMANGTGGLSPSWVIIGQQWNPHVGLFATLPASGYNTIAQLMAGGVDFNKALGHWFAFQIGLNGYPSTPNYTSISSCIQNHPWFAANFPNGLELPNAGLTGPCVSAGPWNPSTHDSYKYTINGGIPMLMVGHQNPNNPNAFNWCEVAPLTCLTYHQPSWDCNTLTGICSDPGTGLGAFSSLAMCQAFCIIVDADCTTKVDTGLQGFQQSVPVYNWMVAQGFPTNALPFDNYMWESDVTTTLPPGPYYTGPNGFDLRFFTSHQLYNDNVLIHTFDGSIETIFDIINWCNANIGAGFVVTMTYLQLNQHIETYWIPTNFPASYTGLRLSHTGCVLPPSCPCGWGPNGTPPTDAQGVYKATPFNVGTTNYPNTHPTCGTLRYPNMPKPLIGQCFQEYLTMPFCVDQATGVHVMGWLVMDSSSNAYARCRSDVQVAALTIQDRIDIFNNTMNVYDGVIGVHSNGYVVIPVIGMMQWGPANPNGSSWFAPFLYSIDINASGHILPSACGITHLACPNTCYGCTADTATNCISNPGACDGYDPTASNLFYLPSVTVDNCCVHGCTNSTGGINPDINGNCSNNTSCIGFGCCGIGNGYFDTNYNPLATCDDGSCVLIVPPTWSCFPFPAGWACQDPGTGLGFWNASNGGQAACQANCITPSWDCSGPPNHTCSDPGTGNGTYSSLIDCEDYCTPTWNCIPCVPYITLGGCVLLLGGVGTYTSLAACDTACQSYPAPPESWNCILGICSDPGCGGGTYPTLAACQAVCNAVIPCEPPPIIQPPNPCLTATYIPSPYTWDSFIDYINLNSGPSTLFNTHVSEAPCSPGPFGPSYPINAVHCADPNVPGSCLRRWDSLRIRNFGSPTNTALTGLYLPSTTSHWSSPNQNTFQQIVDWLNLVASVEGWAGGFTTSMTGLQLQALAQSQSTYTNQDYINAGSTNSDYGVSGGPNSSDIPDISFLLGPMWVYCICIPDTYGMEVCGDYQAWMDGTSSFPSLLALLQHWVNMYALPTMGGYIISTSGVQDLINRCCPPGPPPWGDWCPCNWR